MGKGGIKKKPRCARRQLRRGDIEEGEIKGNLAEFAGKVPRRNKGASFRSLKFQRTRSQNSRSRRKIFETRPDIFENFMNAA